MNFFLFIFFSASKPTYSTSGTSITFTGDGEITSTIFLEIPNYKIATFIRVEGDISSIASSAFSSCSSLQKIYIGEKVSKLTGESFSYCSTLKSIEVSKNNLNFANDTSGALYSYDLTVLIKVPAALTSYIFSIRTNTISSFAFQQSKMSNLQISKYVKSFKYAVFHDSSISNITFEPNSELTVLDYSAFRYLTCKSFFIKFPKSLKSITCKDCFVGCRIGQIEFEEGSQLTSISPQFISGSEISKIVLPDSVKAIPENFIIGNSILETVRIPFNCESIDPQAFTNCPKLREFIIDENHPFFSSENGIIMNKNKTTIAFFPPSYSVINVSKECETISGSSLRSAKDLVLINISKENKFLRSENGVLFNFDMNVLKTICGGIKSVSIPESVTEIEESAAAQCVNLEFVNMSECKIEVISDGAFQGCSKLTRVIFPKSLTHINTNAFRNSALESISFDTSFNIRLIGDASFYNTNITSVSIPSSITSIGSMAFYQCRKLSTITLGYASNCFIGSSIFETTSATNLIIKSSVESLGIRMFAGTSLRSITFEETPKIKEIPNQCFRWNYIKSIKIPKSVESIESLVFENCQHLETVEFEAECEISTINASVFKDCIKLHKVIFPSSLRNIQTPAFIGCTSLKEFIFNGQYMKSKDGLMVNIDETVLLACPVGKDSVIINKEINIISSGAFQHCQLSSIQFDTKKLKEIPDNCFFGCQNLTTIAIPKSVSKLGQNSFYTCTALGSVFFEDGSALSEVGDACFFGCNSLSVFESQKANINIIKQSSFEGCPIESFDLSKLNEIGRRAFANCAWLKIVSIPAVNTVSESCFDGCSRLEEITLASGIKMIGARAFAATRIASITIPESVAVLGDGVLAGTSSIRTVLFCGLEPNEGDTSARIVDEGQMKSCVAYVPLGYDGDSFYGLSALQVLRGDCSLIQATRTATSLFTIGGEEFAEGMLCSAVLFSSE